MSYIYTVCVANSIAETHFQILRPAISVRKCHACWMQGCNEDHCISLLSLSPSLSLSFLSHNSFLLPFFLFSPHPFFPLSLSLSLFSSLTRSSPSLSLPPSLSPVVSLVSSYGKSSVSRARYRGSIHISSLINEHPPHLMVTTRCCLHERS